MKHLCTAPAWHYSIPCLFSSGGDQDDVDDAMEPYHHAGVTTRGQCQRYDGATCSKFVGNRNVFVRSNSNQHLLEEQVTGKSLIITVRLFLKPHLQQGDWHDVITCY